MPRASAALLAAAAALVLGACGGTGRVEQGEGSAARGKQLFVEKCAGCHTLADAGAQGTIGPNLDQTYAHPIEQGFSEDSIRNLVRTQIAYPVEDPVTGQQGMPANLVTGEDADSVARYVASVAGRPVAPGQDGEELTAGDEIFTANCAGCHTLAAARSSGTVGPDLDAASPPLDRVVETVTNGRGQMPAFGDRLTEEQIQSVSEYVAENAGK